MKAKNKISLFLFSTMLVFSVMSFGQLAHAHEAIRCIWMTDFVNNRIADRTIGVELIPEDNEDDTYMFTFFVRKAYVFGKSAETLVSAKDLNGEDLQKIEARIGSTKFEFWIWNVPSYSGNFPYHGRVKGMREGLTLYDFELACLRE